MKRAAIDHPKMRRLRVHLKVPLYAAIGIMESIWHFTAKFAPAGDIGRWMDEVIADAVGWPIENAAELVASLIASGWVDRDDNCRLIVHDWPDHCEDQVHSSLARQRLRFADGSVPRLRQLAQAERAEAEKAYAAATGSHRQPPAPTGSHRHPPAATGTHRQPAGSHRHPPAATGSHRQPALPCHALPSHSPATPTPSPEARANESRTSPEVAEAAEAGLPRGHQGTAKAAGEPGTGNLSSRKPDRPSEAASGLLAIPPEFDPRADEAWQSVANAVEQSGMAKPHLSHPRRLKLLAALDQGLKPVELAEAVGWWASSPESPRMRGMGTTIDTPLSDPVKYLDMARAPPPKSKAEAAKDALDSLVFDDKPEVKPRVRR